MSFPTCLVGHGRRMLVACAGPQAVRDPLTPGSAALPSAAPGLQPGSPRADRSAVQTAPLPGNQAQARVPGSEAAALRISQQGLVGRVFIQFLFPQKGKLGSSRPSPAEAQ